MVDISVARQSRSPIHQKRILIYMVLQNIHEQISQVTHDTKND